jgi:hypothetical protein
MEPMPDRGLFQIRGLMALSIPEREKKIMNNEQGIIPPAGRAGNIEVMLNIQCSTSNFQVCQISGGW